MSADVASDGVESLFQRCLNGAITMGERPARDAGLGSGTCAAIDLVAMNHPEAEARLIADAFDAYALEHGACSLPVEPPAHPVARTKNGTARKDRFRIK